MAVEGHMGILKKTVTALGLSATVFGLMLSGAPVASATEGVVFNDAIGLSKDGSLWLYHNNAIPGWPFSGGSMKIGQGFDKYTDIKFADMDNDGRPDIVAYPKNQKAKVLLNNGSMTSPFADAPLVSDIDYYMDSVFARLNGKLLLTSQRPFAGDPPLRLPFDHQPIRLFLSLAYAHTHPALPDSLLAAAERQPCRRLGLGLEF